MAIQCKQCGTSLPRDDARFCTNCGAAVHTDATSSAPPAEDSSRSAAAPSSSAQPASSPAVKVRKKVLREQIAMQPGAFSSAQKLSERKEDEAPLPREQSHNGVPSGDEDIQREEDLGRVEQAAPVSEVAVSPAPATAATATDVSEQPTQAVMQYGAAASSAPALPRTPAREEPQMRVRPQPDTPIPPISENIDIPPVPPLSPQRQTGSRDSYPAVSPVLADAEEQRVVALEHSPTTLLDGQSRRSSVAPVMPLLARHFRDRFADTKNPVVRLLLAVILPILILGAIGVWILIYQPFNVSPVTQPWQRYSETPSGISIQYPTDWSLQVNRDKSMVQFSDSTHTAQVVVVSALKSSGSIDQFTQQEAKQFGIGSLKPLNSLTFAGATWQQVQGSAQVSGANYSGRILATMHGGRYYAIIEQSPAATYSDEEQIIFAPMRSSMKFL